MVKLRAINCSSSLLKKIFPIFSTAFFYLLYYLISTFKFDVQIDASAIFYDFLLQLAIAYILFSISKRIWAFLVIQALLMGVLYIGNAVKMSFFGGPIVPDDVFALQALLLILEGWKFFVLAIPLAAIASLLVFNFTMRHWTAYLAILSLILLGITISYHPSAIIDPLDKLVGGYSIWDQRSNYLWRGATHYSLQESARFFAATDIIPDSDEAQMAVADQLNKKLVAQPIKEIKPFSLRNVHIVLLESFWDTNELKKANFSQNPLVPEFRKLWKSTAYSHALVPVFGGGTANSEFEVLCGFPVTKSSVKFERELLNAVPCLPHILADKGYRTIVSHPNVPVFWNRINAYRRLGFQTYWSKEDFLMEDMNGDFLSDSSLYRQVLEKISGTLERKQPILDYIVTYFGHWGYPLNESRPKKIRSRSKVEEVSAYANTTYYKSLELMIFLDQLKLRDPDGIIVVFGDHLPFLGYSFEGYVDSGVLPSNSSKFTPGMFKFYVSTPIIIVDGKNGALKIGNIPLYQVPKLLLNLLNYNEPSIMDYVVPLQNINIRPLPGMHFDLLKDGAIDMCKEPPYSDTCQKSLEWMKNISIISNDLFIGRQYTRPKHMSIKPSEPLLEDLVGSPLHANDVVVDH